MKTSGFFVLGIVLLSVISIVVFNSKIGLSQRFESPAILSEEFNCVTDKDCFVNALVRANYALLPASSGATESSLKFYLSICLQANNVPNPQIYAVSFKDLPILFNCKKLISHIIYGSKESIQHYSNTQNIYYYLSDYICPTPPNEELIISFLNQDSYPRRMSHTMNCIITCNAPGGGLTLTCQGGSLQNPESTTITITGPTEDIFTMEWVVTSSTGVVSVGSRISGITVVSLL